MTDELDLLTRARDRLVELDRGAADGPWIAEYSREQGNCVIPHDAKSTREAVAVTRLLTQQADAELIAELRRFVPSMIAMLDVAIAYAEGGGAIHQTELGIAEMILGESERQNNG